MRHIFILLLIGLLCSAFKGYAQKMSNSPVKIEVFLDNDMLKDASINVKFINSIEYTPNGFLLLSSSNQFYMLGMGGMSSILNKTKAVIDAFAVTQDEALWVVSGNKLYNMDSQGNLSNMFNLPIPKAGVTSGNAENVAYIYDRTFQKGKKEYAVYQISDKGIYAKLLSTPAPILSVCEYKTSLLLSTENKILCADSKTKTFFDLYSLPQKQNIISVTCDTVNRSVYFSTQDTIYRIKESKLEYVCTEFGGILRYDGEGLLVFNPEKSLIIRFRNNILYSRIRKKRDLSNLELSIDATSENEKLSLLLSEPRNLIIQGQISQAIQKYAQLADKNSTNSALLTEYAYALALGGIYEGALMNLDRAKLFGAFSEKDYFFAGQVFALMGYNEPAIDFLKHSSVPEWIYPKYNELYQKHKSVSFMPQGDGVESVFKRANYLAATGMYFQSIALYEQILEEQPDNYLFHIGYSIPLEKVGLLKLASNELETGISLMGNNPEYDQAKQAFNSRLTALKQKQNAEPSKQTLGKLQAFNPKTMLYAGGMFSSSYTAFNSRFGVYLSNSFTASFGLGISGNSDVTYFNIGISGYHRPGRVFVYGLGINGQAGGDMGVFSIKPSVGLSFVNQKRNASWDFFFDLYCPLQEGVGTRFGFSIGRSFYFGKR